MFYGIFFMFVLKSWSWTNSMASLLWYKISTNIWNRKQFELQASQPYPRGVYWISLSSPRGITTVMQGQNLGNNNMYRQVSNIRGTLVVY